MHDHESDGTRRPPILVVEDDPAVRQTLVRILETRGHRVLAAADGFQALAHCGRETPSLVVLDFMMPGMDGGALLEALRDRLADAMPPAVLVTASEAHRLEAVALGAQQGLIKPFRVNELLDAVDRYRRRVAGESS